MKTFLSIIFPPSQGTQSNLCGPLRGYHNDLMGPVREAIVLFFFFLPKCVQEHSHCFCGSLLWHRHITSVHYFSKVSLQAKIVTKANQEIPSSRSKPQHSYPESNTVNELIWYFHAKGERQATCSCTTEACAAMAGLTKVSQCLKSIAAPQTVWQTFQNCIILQDWTIFGNLTHSANFTLSF